MLTGNDLTLGYHGEQRVRSLGDGAGASSPISYAFGHHLSDGVGESDRWDHAMENQRKEHVVHIHGPDARVLHPVDLTGAFGRPDFSENREPTSLFRGGFYLSPMAGSSSFSWSFALI